jgi:hypothetical protein
LRCARSSGWVSGDLVLPNPREQHYGTAVGVRELSEQMLIGTHAERLIITPDDHAIEEPPCPAK